MIELITGLPDDTVGFNAKGKVTGEDYETVLIPLVEEKLKTHKKINVLYHCGKDFDSFEAHAMWDDAKTGFIHWHSWNKIAIVTDVSWIRGSSKVFGLLIPAKVKLFENKDLDEAVKWVSE